MLLGVVCGTRLFRRDRIPWKWLAAFGFTHGVNECVFDLLAISLGLGGNTAFTAFRLLGMAVSYLFLVEFGRNCLLITSPRHASSRWIYLPLICLASLGVFGGLNGLNASSRYFLGFVGGLMGGAGLIWLSRHGSIHERGREPDLRSRPDIHLMLAGSFILVYAVAAGLVVPKAPFLPASMVNVDSFFNLFGFPIQFVRAFCAVAITLALWSRLERTMRNDGDFAFYIPWLVPALLMIVVLGWWFTSVVGNRLADGLIDETRNRVEAMAVCVNPERVHRLTGEAGNDNLESRGGVEAFLRKTGLRDNTIVIFMADL